MALFNFQERFVPFIQDGTKTQTIRTIRSYPQKVGAPMHLYSGLRTKYAKRIIEPPTCTAVHTIFLFESGNVFIAKQAYTKIEAREMLETLLPIEANAKPDGEWLRFDEKDQLAFVDGFKHGDKPMVISGCFEIMLRWWKLHHDLPFVGHINYWR